MRFGKYTLFAIGIFLLVVVDFLWTISSILVQQIVENYYNKPIMTTYFSCSVFAMYLPVYYTINALRRKYLRRKVLSLRNKYTIHDNTQYLSTANVLDEKANIISQHQRPDGYQVHSNNQHDDNVDGDNDIVDTIPNNYQHEAQQSPYQSNLNEATHLLSPSSSSVNNNNLAHHNIISSDHTLANGRVLLANELDSTPTSSMGSADSHQALLPTKRESGLRSSVPIAGEICAGNPPAPQRVMCNGVPVDPINPYEDYLQSYTIVTNEAHWPVFWHNFKLALIVAPCWFLMNVTYNVALSFTTVTINSVLSTASGFFVIIFSTFVFCTPLHFIHIFCVFLAFGSSAMVTMLGASPDSGNSPQSFVAETLATTVAQVAAAPHGFFRTILGPALSLSSAMLYGVYSVVLEHCSDREKNPYEQKKFLLSLLKQALFEEKQLETAHPEGIISPVQAMVAIIPQIVPETVRIGNQLAPAVPDDDSTLSLVKDIIQASTATFFSAAPVHHVIEEDPSTAIDHDDNLKAGHFDSELIEGGQQQQQQQHVGTAHGLTEEETLLPHTGGERYLTRISIAQPGALLATTVQSGVVSAYTSDMGMIQVDYPSATAMLPAEEEENNEQATPSSVRSSGDAALQDNNASTNTLPTTSASTLDTLSASSAPPSDVVGDLTASPSGYELDSLQRNRGGADAPIAHSSRTHDDSVLHDRQQHSSTSGGLPATSSSLGIASHTNLAHLLSPTTLTAASSVSDMNATVTLQPTQLSLNPSYAASVDRVLLAKQQIVYPTNLDPKSPKIITGLLFGCVGVVNLIGAWPVLLLLHFTGFETLELPSGKAIPLLAANSCLGAAFSDFLWANAVILTSPLIATLAIPGTIPLAMLYSWWFENTPPNFWVILGSIGIVTASTVITFYQYYSNRYDDLLIERMRQRHLATWNEAHPDEENALAASR